MDQTTDTNAIDEKKNGKNKTVENISSVLISTIVFLFVVIGYYSFSGAFLYLCKVCQSNVLPTDINCFPYTSSKPDIENIQTNIFSNIKQKTSMKLNIPKNDSNLSNFILEQFRNIKDNSTSPVVNYFVTIINGLFSYNYSSLNSIMNNANTMPESIMINVLPIMFLIFYTINLLISQIYFIYLVFSNLPKLFKNDYNPVNIAFGIFMSIVFSILFLMFYPIFTLIPVFVSTWTSLTGLFVKGNLNGNDVSVFDIIKMTFVHYKGNVMFVLSFLLIILMFNKIGSLAGIISTSILLCIYFGFINIDLFKPMDFSDSTEFTPFSSFSQAKKSCTPSSLLNENGFLNWLTTPHNKN